VAEAAKRSVAAKAPLPATPKSTTDFEAALASLRRDPARLGEYLRQLAPAAVPKLFRRPLEPDGWAQLLPVVAEHVAPADAGFAAELLAALASTPQFGTAALMFGRAERDAAEAVARAAGAHEAAAQVRAAYLA
jgi:hypothetical protein